MKLRNKGGAPITLLILLLLPALALAEPVARIALVIDDLGYQPNNDRAVLELDSRVTVAIIPDGPLAPELSRLAAGQKREVLIHLPLAGDYHDDCEPALRCMDKLWPPLQMASHLRWAMSRVEHAAGINNHQGSRFTADTDATRNLVEGISILNRLFDHSLFVLDSRTSAQTQLEFKARKAGLAAARRNIFLDNTREPAHIAAAWQDLLEHARRHGSGIAIGHPHPETIEFLRHALPVLESQGIELVPISALVVSTTPPGESAEVASVALP